MKKEITSKSFLDYVRVIETLVIKSSLLVLSLASLVGVVAAEFGFSLRRLPFLEWRPTWEILGPSLVSVAVALAIGSFSTEIVAKVRKLSGRGRVFISYPHDVRELAMEISKQLEQKGVRVWLDVANIKPGDHIRESIERGITNSDVLIFVIPSSLTEVSRHELDLALKKHLKVIPVVVANSSVMPKELAGISHVNLVEDEEQGIEKIVRSIV
jgi:hypothetical protein